MTTDDRIPQHDGAAKCPPQPERAYAAAARRCAAAEYCRSDWHTRFRRQGFDPTTAKALVDRLESEGYINEDRYIRAFVHDKAAYDGWTARKISMALARKGLDAQRVQAAIDEGIDSDQQMALLEACLRRALSKGRADEDPRKTTARAIRAAAAKGFAPADIYRMLRTMTAETPDDD